MQQAIADQYASLQARVAGACPNGLTNAQLQTMLVHAQEDGDYVMQAALAALLAELS